MNGIFYENILNGLGMVVEVYRNSILQKITYPLIGFIGGENIPQKDTFFKLNKIKQDRIFSKNEWLK